MKREKITGLIAAPFTPFTPAGEINLERIKPYAALLVRNGVAGAFVCGSSGEGQSMDAAERMAVTEAWLDAVPKDFKIIVHVGSNSLPDVKRLLAHAQTHGAYACGALAPSYHKPANVKMLAAWLAEVAPAAPELPFYYYHIPAMTGLGFPMFDLLKEIDGRIPNFAGIKYTFENLMDFSQCLEFQDRKYDMLFGRDELLYTAMGLGARGAVGSTFNFAAPIYLDIIAKTLAGDGEAANRLQTQVHAMLQAIFSLGLHPLAVQKAVMRFVGVDCGPVRLPLPQPTPADSDRIARALESVRFSSYCCR